jgi:hypothetical protein
MSPKPFEILRLFSWIVAALCGLGMAVCLAASAIGMPAASQVRPRLPFLLCALALSVTNALINERALGQRRIFCEGLARFRSCLAGQCGKTEEGTEDGKHSRRNSQKDKET